MKALWGSQADAVVPTGATVGGRGGGICRGSGGEPLLVIADRLAIDPDDAMNLSLAGASLRQGPEGCLQMCLQDVHSSYPFDFEGWEVMSSSTLTGWPRRPSQRLIDARSGWGNLRWP